MLIIPFESRLLLIFIGVWLLLILFFCAVYLFCQQSEIVEQQFMCTSWLFGPPPFVLIKRQSLWFHSLQFYSSMLLSLWRIQSDLVRILTVNSHFVANDSINISTTAQSSRRKRWMSNEVLVQAKFSRRKCYRLILCFDNKQLMKRVNIFNVVLLETIHRFRTILQKQRISTDSVQIISDWICIFRIPLKEQWA